MLMLGLLIQSKGVEKEAIGFTGSFTLYANGRKLVHQCAHGKPLVGNLIVGEKIPGL